MYAAQMKVRRFHEVFGCAVEDSPTWLNEDLRELRLRLIEEEFHELQLAFFSPGQRGKQDMVAVADAMGDLLYVTLGTAVACGINIDPIFEAIHNSNMLKVGGKMREDGKILKPEGWQPPNIRELLIQQGWKP